MNWWAEAHPTDYPSPLAGDGKFSIRGTSVRQREPPKNEASDPVLRKGKTG